MPMLTSPFSKASKPRSKFSKEDDLVIVRKIAAAKAHVAPSGETRERFEIAAAELKARKSIKQAVTRTCVLEIQVIA